MDGPDVWIAVKVKPEGPHRLSLYFYNKDGHEAMNRCRDYLIEVREYCSPLPEKVAISSNAARLAGLPKSARSMDLTNAIPETVLARTRVKDFWGGVYKSVTVQGPGMFYIRVARHGSHNAIVSGVFVDTIPEPREDPKNLSPNIQMMYRRILYEAPDPGDAGKHPDLATAATLWEEAQDICGFTGGPEAYYPARLMAYRQAINRKAPENLLGDWRWHLGIWTEQDRKTFSDSMVEIWAGIQEASAYSRSAAFRPYSPNVIPFTPEECVAMKNNNIDWRMYIPPGNPYRVHVTANRFPTLCALFGTTNVTKETKALTSLGKLQTDKERQLGTNVTPRARVLMSVNNALSAAERTQQAATDVFEEIETRMMPLLRMSPETVTQETETLQVLIRYLALRIAREQVDVRFVWFHIKARIKRLKAENRMTSYNEVLKKNPSTAVIPKREARGRNACP